MNSKFIRVNTLVGDEIILMMSDIILQKYTTGTYWMIPKYELCCEDPFWRELSAEAYGAIIDEINRYA